MKKIILSAILICLSAVSIFAQIKTTTVYFDKINSFLTDYVKAGTVNYKAINANKIALDELVNFAASKQKFNSILEEKTFYLNTYNVMVIKGIISNYPTKGPLTIPGFFDKKTYTVNGTNITLNGIENDMIRKKYNDARIHFALVCGAISCPPIPSYSFKPEKLEAQLDVLTKQSIQNNNFTKYDSKNNKLNVSMLFEWYKEDFIKSKGSVLAFINAYSKKPFAANTTITNYTYDWSLNGK